MQRLAIFLLLSAGCVGEDVLADPDWVPLFDRVDPFIGTGGEGFGYGGLSPAATTPNGLVEVGWVELDRTAWAAAYAEGSAWQYTWMVPHDLPGLAALFGSRAALRDNLNEWFERSAAEPDGFLPDIYYWHGNEPDIHAAYIFAALGDPAATQEWVAWVRDTKYGIAAGGLDGNDDGGTLSAWYVFAALGLYPFNGTDQYVLSSPLFDTAVIHHPGGDLAITAANSGEYLAAVTHDGVPMDRALISHGQLIGGHRLDLRRSAEPTPWGVW